MKKYYIIVLFILTCSNYILSEKSLAVFPEVIKPIKLIVVEKNIFVVEEYRINIYNRLTLKFKKSFGKRGEGPKEFPRPIQVNFFKNMLVVVSFNKILWFSEEGAYINEKKKSPLSFQITPINGGYLQNKMKFSKHNRNIEDIIAIFDKKMELKKVLSTEVIRFNNNRKKLTIPASKYKKFSIADKKNIILIDTRKKKSIKIFDHQGIFINSIAQEFPKVIITEEYKKKLNKYEINNARNRMKKKLLKEYKREFTKYFLPFSFVFSEEDIIYIFRDINKFSKYEVWAMGKSGKVINKNIVNKSNLFCIENGIYYYILENEEEDEEWELFSQNLL